MTHPRPNLLQAVGDKLKVICLNGLGRVGPVQAGGRGSDRVRVRSEQWAVEPRSEQ